jgi:hypothetical protein
MQFQLVAIGIDQVKRGAFRAVLFPARGVLHARRQPCERICGAVESDMAVILRRARRAQFEA